MFPDHGTFLPPRSLVLRPFLTKYMIFACHFSWRYLVISVFLLLPCNSLFQILWGISTFVIRPNYETFSISTIQQHLKSLQVLLLIVFLRSTTDTQYSVENIYLCEFNYGVFWLNVILILCEGIFTSREWFCCLVTVDINSTSYKLM